MAYKILGVIALMAAAFMALVGLLVLVTFFTNFNAGLLILFVVAVVFTWLFFAVGWQLMRPPRSKGTPPEPRASDDDEVAPAGLPAVQAAGSVMPACGPSEEVRVPIEAAGSFQGLEDQDIGEGRSRP